MGLVGNFKSFAEGAALAPSSLISSFKLGSLYKPAMPIDYYEQIPPREPLVKPRDWQEVSLLFEGTYVPCFVSRAEHETGIVGLATGMSSTPLDADWRDNVARLNESGKTVISFGLLHTAHFPSYYDINRRLIDAFFLDQAASPFYTIGDPDAKRTAMLHSTSCALFLDSISRRYALQRKPEQLTNAIYLNPLIDTYRSSKGHHPVGSALLSAFMSARGSNGMGETPLEQWFAGEEEVSHDPKFGRPEHSRVRATREKVRAFTDSVYAGGREDVSPFPQKMYLGRKDKLVCRASAEALAGFMGFEAQAYDANHYNLFENPEALASMNRRIDTRPVHDRSPHETALTTAGSYDEELRRFSVPDECGASALDAGAGLG